MRYIKIVAVVIAVAIALGILGISAGCVPFEDKKDEGDIEYRTEILPIKNRFPDLPEFTMCYWKADTIGHINFGPTSYWMRGFVCLEEEAFQQVLTDYTWKEESIAFPTGIDPSITGKSNFRWHSNAEFESLILQQNFVGTVLLDTNNGILYFSVENM